jgi:ketosteroid isomerase-like protein
MSEETLRVARETYEAWNGGDIASVLASVPEEYEFHMTGGRPPGLPSVLRGREGMRQLLQEWISGPWQGVLRMDVDHLIDVGDDRVLALLTFRGTGEGSGAAVKQPYSHVTTIRDGRLVRTDGFVSWARAIRAAGLELSALPPREDPPS